MDNKVIESVVRIFPPDHWSEKIYDGRNHWIKVKIIIGSFLLISTTFV